MATRREKIEAMLAQEPGDVFLRYSLAMELEKANENARSLQMLSELAAESPPYVPAYFMAAQQHAKLGQIAESRTVLREGIEAARRSGDAHAAGEMSEFLASLGSLGE